MRVHCKQWMKPFHFRLAIATVHIRGKIKSMPYRKKLKRCEEETRNWHGKEVAMLLEEIKLEKRVIMSAFSSDVTNFNKSDRQQNKTDTVSCSCC